MLVYINCYSWHTFYEHKKSVFTPTLNWECCLNEQILLQIVANYYFFILYVYSNEIANLGISSC